jgi:hypothetical protein
MIRWEPSEALCFGRTRGVAPEAVTKGTEPPMTKREPESPAKHEPVMEEICAREILLHTLQRVIANKGSLGIDGMTVE